jgi:CMP-N-acetylneuraminic acid synthetase
LSKKHSNNQIVTVSLKNKKKPNGVLYLTPRNILFKRKNFSYKNFKSVILKSKKETLDIDTIDDFNFAKKLLNTKLK